MKTTTDGMYIDRLTRVSRLPGSAYPDTADELKKVSFSQFSRRSEHFSGECWDVFPRGVYFSHNTAEE